MESLYCSPSWTNSADTKPIITGRPGVRGTSRSRPGVRVCCGVALALDVGQAFGELAIPDPDDIHATYVPVPPVVAPADDGAS